MSGKEAATWKTVSTLEWKKKQKAPAEPKGFGAILGEAADVVVDKWTAAGAYVPAHNSRMSEIQMQDEAYIHQQLVNPEEGKIKRGLQRLISIGRSKASKGVRILRPGGSTSRKVRFTEVTNSSKSATGGQQPAAAGTAAAGLGVVKGNSISKQAPAAPGALKSGLRVGDSTVAGTTASSAAAGPGVLLTHAGVSQPSNAAHERPPASASNAGSSNGSKTPVALPLQQTSSSGVSCSEAAGTPINASGSSSRGSSGGGSTASGITAVYLQQQSAQQAPQTPSLAAAGINGSWECGNKTGLADKQLQRLRTTTTPPVSAAAAAAAAAAAEQLDLPLGYRPLAIPEQTFERWSVAGGGGGAAGSSRQTHLSLDTLPATAGSAAASSADRARSSARRGSNADAAPAMQPEAGQLGGAHSSSREFSTTLQRGGSSGSPDLVAAAAAATGGNGVSSHSSGDAASSKQRRTTDFLSSSTEALHPTRRSGGCGHSPSNGVPTGTGGSGSSSQRPSSPRSRHTSSSSSITTVPQGPAACSGAAPALNGKASRSSSLPDVQELAQQPQQQQRSPSPFKNGAAVGGGGVLGSNAAATAAGAGGPGRSSRPNSNTTSSRITQDAAGSAGRAQAATSPIRGGRGGSNPGTSSSSSRVLETQQQVQQRRSSACASSIAVTSKTSSSLVHLPVITKPAANHSSIAASSGAATK